jgi:hypothetical protein
MPVTDSIYIAQAVAFFFLALRMLYFMGFFRSLALFKKLLGDIFSSLKYFFIVFFIIIFSFAVPFMLLTRKDDHTDDNFDHLENWEWWKPYLTLYLGTIGEYGFAMDHFEVENEETGEIMQDKLNITVSWLFFLVFAFISQIIMLNLIVGIVSAVYEEAKANEVSTLYAVRCSLTSDLISQVAF